MRTPGKGGRRRPARQRAHRPHGGSGNIVTATGGGDVRRATARPSGGMPGPGDPVPAGAERNGTEQPFIAVRADHYRIFLKPYRVFEYRRRVSS